MSKLLKTVLVLVIVCFAVGPLMGCKSAPATTAGAVAGAGDQPQWVDDPEGAFPGDRGKVLYAVGFSENALNRQMTRRRAEADGRNKLAEVLRVHVQSMVKDWMATSTDYVKPENTTSKQFTEVVSRQVTSAVLVGSRSSKYYTAPDKSVAVLMSLQRDDPFFEAIKKQAEEALKAMKRDEQEKVLKVRMEDALKSLDGFLETKKPQQ